MHLLKIPGLRGYGFIQTSEITGFRLSALSYDHHGSGNHQYRCHNALNLWIYHHFRMRKKRVQKNHKQQNPDKQYYKSHFFHVLILPQSDPSEGSLRYGRDEYSYPFHLTGFSCFYKNILMENIPERTENFIKKSSFQRQRLPYIENPPGSIIDMILSCFLIK